MKNKSDRLSCATPGCIESVGSGLITGLCKRCYSSVYSWTKRSNADVINRVKNLHLYESRINFLLPKSKVKILRPKNDYIPLVVLPGQVKAYRKRTKYKVIKQEKKATTV